MDEIRRCTEHVVTAGIRAYIGLLCCGEKERSRRVLSDTMQISSIVSGGPSARFPLAPGGVATGGSQTLARVLIFFTLRSLLASLLVLRATAYWNRVPALRDLQEACALLNRCLGEGIAEAATGAAVHDEVGEARRRLDAGDDGDASSAPVTSRNATRPRAGSFPE